MIRHVIFDCFGTLLNTSSLSVNAARQILSNLHSDLDPAEFYAEWKQKKRAAMFIGEFRTEKQLFIDTLDEMFAEYGLHADAKSAVHPMIDAVFAERPLFPDVKPTLSFLCEAGIDTAIGSTTDTDAFYAAMERNGISFRHVFTSESLRVYKPDKRFYDGILDGTGWAAEECLFVGDNPVDDVLGPHKSGIRAVLIDRKHQGSSEADFLIRTLTELIDIIKEDSREL